LDKLEWPTPIRPKLEVTLWPRATWKKAWDAFLSGLRWLSLLGALGECSL
jgi:hypothetical protein